MLNYKLSKKAQIGETATWIVATVIIVIILVISLVLTTSPSIKHKELPYTNKVDLFADKSLSAYLMTKDPTGIPVYTALQSNQANDFSKNLAGTIFVGLYSGYYTYLILDLNPGSTQLAGFFSSAGASPTDYTVHSTVNLINKESINLEMSHRT
jgi:hypothetical protein